MYDTNRERAVTFIRNVKQEILNIQAGEGKWRRGSGLYFETNKAVPVFATLERFEATLSKKAFDEFIAQASQDLGKATGDGFKDWGQGLFTEVKEDGTPAPQPSKKFEAKLFDGFYSVFKVARISLEPKQIAAFEQATAKLALTFSEEIHREMRTQLAETVAKLKDSEVKDQSSE